MTGRENSRATVIAVIGTGEHDPVHTTNAHAVGAALARAGCIVITGGLGGVMRAASRGAREAGGLVVGVVPGSSPNDANEFVDVPIASGVGEARNAILANTAAGFVAVGGSWGTLSEIAFANKHGKPVAGIGSFAKELGVEPFDDAPGAVEWLLGQLA